MFMFYCVYTLISHTALTLEFAGTIHHVNTYACVYVAVWDVC